MTSSKSTASGWSPTLALVAQQDGGHAGLAEQCGQRAAAFAFGRQRMQALPIGAIQPLQIRRGDQGLVENQRFAGQLIHGRRLDPAIAVRTHVSGVQAIDHQANGIHDSIGPGCADVEVSLASPAAENDKRTLCGTLAAAANFRSKRAAGK